MRDYGKLATSFWTSDDIRGLSTEGKLLAAYLLTGPHTTQLGCFRCPEGYVSEDLGWSSETVSERFMELFRNGFITLDQRSGWVLINKFLKFNRVENPNQGKSAAKLFEQIPDSLPLKRELSRQIRQFASHFPADALDRYETVAQTVPKPLPEPYRNQKQEQEQKLTSTCDREQSNQPAIPGIDPPHESPAPKPAKPPKPQGTRFDDFWTTWPTSPRKVAKAKCAEAWARRKLDEHADRIIAHVSALKTSEQWRTGFEPAPLTYLNQSRWQDGEPAQPQGNGTTTTTNGNGHDNPRLKRLMSIGPQPDGTYIDASGGRWGSTEEYLRAQAGAAFEPAMVTNLLAKWDQNRAEAAKCSPAA